MEDLRLEDVSADRAVSIDVQFGAIRFVREGGASFALACVDVAIGEAEEGAESENIVRMDVRIAARPEDDSVLAIVEKSRRAIIERLRSAAAVLETRTAESLLFGDEA